ncbi:MAG: SocA family protein, partial [Muribaculaceae bacterium]|nr:SocA family protein [Muribaculaceae bacterium]
MNKLFKFEKSVNSILYVLKQMGGRCDMHKLCKILYFADREHLSEFGRRITGDTYIAMQYGPVPSCIDDILKALRGDSFFSSSAEIKEIKDSMTFENRFIIRGLKNPDLDELSGSDILCLDKSIN